MHTAVVAEGGGQRGIYTAGLLDSLMEADVNPFTLGVGVSSGAQNLLAYFLQQPGYSQRAITEYTAARDFFVPYRWLGARGIVDLDSYFERSVNDPEFRLPYQQIATLQTRQRLVFVATSQYSLEPVYLEPDARTVVNDLKASCAVPFLYKSGVVSDDEVLVEGGVSDPLPVIYAYQQGARRIAVIRTCVDRYEASQWRARLTSLGRLHTLPLRILRMLERYEQAYAEAVAFIQHPPDDLELMLIGPKSPLCSQVIGSRAESLLADYEIGKNDGVRTAERLSRWFESDSSIRRTGQIGVVERPDSVC
ncbi:MAG: patatin-like phospholipase family protein [Granulosicoccus sp.]